MGALYSSLPKLTDHISFLVFARLLLTFLFVRPVLR